MKKTLQRKSAQSIIEFTFATMALVLLMYGLVQCYRWVMMDLVDRRYTHEATLTNRDATPEQQLAPNFYTPRKLDTFYYRKQ